MLLSFWCRFWCLQGAGQLSLQCCHLHIFCTILRDRTCPNNSRLASPGFAARAKRENSSSTPTPPLFLCFCVCVTYAQSNSARSWKWNFWFLYACLCMFCTEGPPPFFSLLFALSSVFLFSFLFSLLTRLMTLFNLEFLAPFNALTWLGDVVNFWMIKKFTSCT